MIWQLIRRDAACRRMPWLILANVTTWVLWHFSQASLPITVRPIYLSHVLPMLVPVWLTTAIIAFGRTLSCLDLL